MLFHDFSKRLCLSSESSLQQGTAHAHGNDGETTSQCWFAVGLLGIKWHPRTPACANHDAHTALAHISTSDGQK